MKPGVETRTVAEAERERLKRDHLEAFYDGGRAALGLPDASRKAGNYPCGFCGWPLEKRNAWFSGYGLAYCERLRRRDGEAE